MSRVKSKDTKIEVEIRSRLHCRGLRFRKHVKTLPGSPDVVFVRDKVVVFIDGDFWHGRNFEKWRNTMSRYWTQKIERNMRRDRKNARRLRALGWSVVRIWEKAAKKDLDAAVSRIEKKVKEAKSNRRIRPLGKLTRRTGANRLTKR